MCTNYHAKYFANELTKHSASNDSDRISMSLFNACVNLTPHQVEAALFAFKSPLSKGVILADEVGLGKTIEAGLVICQYWAERKRNILIICPASLRKQWSLELYEKFNIPNVILEAKTYKQFINDGITNPLRQKNKVIIMSYNFANRYKEAIRECKWDVAVIDEAHKLRNAYKTNNQTATGIKFALNDTKKLLLTATPLQNSLLELYGLTSIISDGIFGDISSFRQQYVNSSTGLEDLKNRLQKNFHSDENEIYYKLKPTGMFNLKKIENDNATKKLVKMWEKRLQRYILTTKQKSFEELFASSIKDMILIGASPNTTGVYLACLLFKGDKSFYVDDIQVLTGWSEEDIKKGLNELEELGEVLVDPVYELVNSEFLPPYFHQNNNI